MLALLTRRAPPPAQEILPLTLADGTTVDIRWVRDPRARRLRLLVGHNGVRLTVPRSASRRLAEAFLDEHRPWLAQQLLKHTPIETRPFMAGEESRLCLRDQWLPVEWCEGRYTRVESDGQGIRIQRTTRTSDRQLSSALRDFYTQQARADLGAWLPKYLPDLPRAPLSIRLRPLSSLWGSLSAGDALSLDLSLVLGRPTAFEYVLVHELCHLIHANHSRRYWREVEKRCPDWRAHRDYLHGDGLALKSELRRLTAA